ncbi:Flavohemoprotein [Tolypocladium ophioglossoides CBS 100239]|uniref:nitric oxide dioxygenase n=1 Tax=Tolypocladium ophioglossoides (strain CBS 100239) TaxID=1163406 RepID=A0A0L0N5X4_TOLOC|nr:Flavohemoprotein [Tolypocladium ophioglossoides CBS 100239]
MALTAKQIAIVKSTAPVVKEHGQTITRLFYKDMLAAHPELKNYFSLRNQQIGAQQAALADAVFAYATHIDDLPRLGAAVERIAQKHASLFIKPEQYPIVGKFLIGAFAKVLGGALTPEIKDAWVAAYGQLADVFIQREKQLYDAAGPDWQSWRRFTIVKKELEAEDVMSYYLEPVDKRPLPKFMPGQYVTLQCRISVKREETVDNASTEDLAAGKVPGLISNMLHRKYNVGDEVELSPPRGEFFFNAATASPSTPIVLLSAGVGATPLVSIVDSILQSPDPSRPLSWVHAAHHSGTVCFWKHIREAAAQHANLKPVLFVSTVRDGDKQGEYVEGRLSLDKLDSNETLHLADSSAEYFICGPEEWMIQTRQWLVDNGVALGRVHLELFRTGDV